MQRLLFFVLFFLVSPALLTPSVTFGKTAHPAVAVAPKDKKTSKKSPPRAKSATKSTVRVKSAPPPKKTSKHKNARPAVAKKTPPKKTESRKKTAARQSTVKKRTQARPSTRSRAASILSTAAAARAGSEPAPCGQISARSVMVMDAASGKPLFEKMADNPRQPASTIKIVTAMIALESLKKDDQVTASRHAADMPSSKIFLEPGASYQADDLISAVLLASANDASVALAEKIAGSEDKFARLMTLSAKMWGAKNTICRTASGLTEVGQQSTARDLANLFRFAMQHESFAQRMQEKYIETSYGKRLRNHNRALWRIDGAVGGKTGYTVAARQTYVGKFTRDGQSIVVAIMGSESMWADLAKLVEYGFQLKQKSS
nr:serine hydrolase [uncultured Desulfobulbus sp.]